MGRYTKFIWINDLCCSSRGADHVGGDIARH